MTTNDEAIQRLLALLPMLRNPPEPPVRKWEGGSGTLPYPTYAPYVEEVIGAISGAGLLDTGYDPGAAATMMTEEGRIERATLDEVRSMLTWCVRGERFCDGHWGEMIERGIVRRLVERLGEVG